MGKKLRKELQPSISKNRGGTEKVEIIIQGK